MDIIDKGELKKFSYIKDSERKEELNMFFLLKRYQ